MANRPHVSPAWALISKEIPIRLPGLEIREPLKPRPISGALVGLITGSLFALLAQEGAFRASREAQTIGFVAGGGIGGGIGGALAPYFRKRLTAALCVGAAASVGLFVANYFWHEWPDPYGSLGLGSLFGVVYGFLLWDYRATPAANE